MQPCETKTSNSRPGESGHGNVVYSNPTPTQKQCSRVAATARRLEGPDRRRPCSRSGSRPRGHVSNDPIAWRRHLECDSGAFQIAVLADPLGAVKDQPSLPPGHIGRLVCGIHFHGVIFTRALTSRLRSALLARCAASFAASGARFQAWVMNSGLRVRHLTQPSISSAISCDPDYSNGSLCFVHGFLKSSANFFNSGQFANRVNQRKARLENNASIRCRSDSRSDASCLNLTSSAVSNPS